VVQRVLPHAAVVADPFHVIQDANRRVDEARRVEQEVHRRKIPS
jgi:transposase